MKSLSLGFTLQISDYEPVKINVMHERDAKEGETDEQHEINLAKEVMANLVLVSKTAVADIQKIKATIMNDLMDLED